MFQCLKVSSHFITHSLLQSFWFYSFMALVTIRKSSPHFGECKEVLLLLLLTTASYKPISDHTGIIIFSSFEIVKNEWGITAGLPPGSTYCRCTPCLFLQAPLLLCVDVWSLESTVFIKSISRRYHDLSAVSVCSAKRNYEGVRLWNCELRLPWSKRQMQTGNRLWTLYSGSSPYLSDLHSKEKESVSWRHGRITAGLTKKFYV